MEGQNALEDENFVKERLVDVFHEEYEYVLFQYKTYILLWMNENVKSFVDLKTMRDYLDDVFSEMQEYNLSAYDKGISMECCTESQKNKFEDTYTDFKDIRSDIIAEFEEDSA